MDELLRLDEQAVLGLAAALACGLVVGFERGWSQRIAEEGQRIAGLRTFTLIGLVGGVLGMIGGDLALASGVIGLAALLGAGYVAAPTPTDRGLTTEVAALATLLLGALATRGHPALAVGLAAVAAALLEAKAPLHRLLQQLAEAELVAGLKLAVLAVLVLPMLPDTDYGPGGLVNPRELGAIVVGLAAVSFLGYWLLKLFGARLGPLLFGLAGGLVSSTALTLSAGRLSRRRPRLAVPLAVAAGAANAVMLVRILVVVTLLAPGLALRIAPALAAAIAASAAVLALLWIRGSAAAHDLPDGTGALIEEPMPLGESVLMAVLVVAVAAAAGFARDAFDGHGVVAVAALAGLVDVDAVTITVARLAAVGDEATMALAGLAVGTAAGVNLATKSTLAWLVGERTFAAATTAALAAAAVGGASVLLAW